MHGLHEWVVSDDPVRRIPRIAERLGSFDLALLQEDFAHHEALRARLGGRLAVRGNPSRFEDSWRCLGVCAGAGLTLVWSGAPEAMRVENVPYDACAGWLGGANDCLATKGFQHARIALPPPAAGTLHVVNTHLDAGRDGKDRAARRAQLASLRAHLEANAPDGALVLGGDLNLHWDDPDDRALLEEFTSKLRLVDSGAAPGAGWERIDYVWVRSGGAIALDVLEAGEAPGFEEAGAPLSDHPPLAVRLRIRPAAQRSAAAPPSTGITAPVR